MQLLAAHQMDVPHIATGLTALPSKRTDNPHPTKDLGCTPVDQLALTPNPAVLRPNPADPGPMGQGRQWDQQEGADQQLPIHERQDAQAPDQLHNRPPWVVKHAVNVCQS